MLAAERRARILDIARQDGAVGISRLADDLGVSHVTVRRDVDSLVAEQILEKVRGGAILRQQGSDTHNGRDRAPTAVGVVGVLIPTTYYYREVVDGITSELERVGGELRLGISDYDADEERRLIEEFLAGGVSGLLWAPSVLDAEGEDSALEIARSSQIPVVLVEREVPGGGLSDLTTIRSAHERGAVSALRHLYDLGHRRIAMVSRGRTQTADFVRAGWASAMSRFGFDAESRVIGPDELGRNPTWPGTGSRIVLDIVEEIGATAIFSHGDENSMFLLLQAARSRGLSVPGDLSVITYDDDEISAHADPPMSAVAPDRFRVGELAVRLLYDRNLREPDATPLHLQVEPRLVLRGSTAPPPGVEESQPVSGLAAPPQARPPR